MCIPPYSGDIETIVLRLPLSKPLGADDKAALYKNVLTETAPEWYNLGLQLGFPASELDTIKKDHHLNNRNAASTFLSQWVDRGGATMDKFLEALVIIGRVVTAEKIRKDYCQ